MPSGEKTGKLTPERVAAFKAVMHSGKSLVELNKEFNEVHVATLCDIRAGKTWRDIKPKGIV